MSRPDRPWADHSVKKVNTPQERRAVQLLVVGWSNTVAEAQELLDIMGLLTDPPAEVMGQ